MSPEAPPIYNEDLFLSLIEMNPILYTRKTRDNANPEYIKQVWELVANKSGLKNIDVAQRKFKYIKEQRRKRIHELQNAEKFLLTSTMTPHPIIAKTDFLGPFIAKRKYRPQCEKTEVFSDCSTNPPTTPPAASLTTTSWSAIPPAWSVKTEPLPTPDTSFQEFEQIDSYENDCDWLSGSSSHVENSIKTEEPEDDSVWEVGNKSSQDRLESAIDDLKQTINNYRCPPVPSETLEDTWAKGVELVFRRKLALKSDKEKISYYAKVIEFLMEQ